MHLISYCVKFQGESDSGDEIVIRDETRPKKAISDILYHIVSNFKESLIPVMKLSPEMRLDQKR
jgi:hypothetical protein